MGLLPKTKEYMIRVFDYAIAKSKVVSQKHAIRVAMASFFLASKVS